MRESLFIQKAYADMQQFGIEFEEKYADKVVDTLTFMAYGLNMDITEELLDAAYFCSGVAGGKVRGVYTAPEELPEYMKLFEGMEGNQYRGFDILTNIVRFRSGYLGEDKMQEDYNVGVIMIMLLEEYIAIPALTAPFNSELTFFVDFIKLAQAMAERLPSDG